LRTREIPVSRPSASDAGKTKVPRKRRKEKKKKTGTGETETYVEGGGVGKRGRETQWQIKTFTVATMKVTRKKAGVQVGGNKTRLEVFS